MSTMIVIDDAVAIPSTVTRSLAVPSGGAGRMTFVVDLIDVTGSVDLTLNWKGESGVLAVSAASGALSSAGVTIIDLDAAFLIANAVPFPNEVVLTIVTGPVSYRLYMVSSD